MQKNSSTHLQAPQILLDDIIKIHVQFFDFDGVEQQGIIEVHKTIKQDIIDLFKLIYEIKFPIHSVRPLIEFGFSDDASMEANNSSCYNFRTVALDPTRISNHGYGVAIDLNPVQNPYIKGNTVLPSHAKYEQDAQGTIHTESEITLFMKNRGFIWGGDWDKPYLDYQHFHKELPINIQRKYETAYTESL